MASASEIYQKDPSMVSREIVGEVILVPIRQNVGDLENIFTLNETAARAWELIDGVRTFGDILQHIVEEFDVEPVEAQQDFSDLLAQLEEIGAVKRL